MINFKAAILFLQKHTESGIWIEKSQAYVYSDASNGNSEGYQISSSAFNFLEQSGLLQKNSYGGFKSIRVFDKQTSINSLDANVLNDAFTKYQAKRKQLLNQDLIQIEKALELPKAFYSNLNRTLTVLNEANIKVTALTGQYRRHQGSSPSTLKIGEQAFTYFSWSEGYREIAGCLTKRVEKIKIQLESEEINDYVSASPYPRAYLGRPIERMIAHLKFA